MESHMTESNDAIARYLRELDTADLARSDLDEIEDHLRTLTADLQQSGMPALEAVTEAARRLGDPRGVAREHARVRTAFGTRLSRFRTYSAALFVVPMLAFSIYRVAEHDKLFSHLGAQLALCTIVTLALVLRLAWARPLLVGGLGFYAIQALCWFTQRPEDAPWVLANVGAFAFVVPWRRHELSSAGWSLALAVWAYGTATLCMYFQSSATLDGDPLLIVPAGLLAMAAGAIATTGGILRARWAAPAALLSAGAIAVALSELWSLRAVVSDPIFFGYYIVYALASGVVTALVAAILAWRTARSTLGTLQYVLR
jgi:hypothetical protein